MHSAVRLHCLLHRKSKEKVHVITVNIFNQLAAEFWC